MKSILCTLISMLLIFQFNTAAFGEELTDKAAVLEEGSCGEAALWSYDAEASKLIISGSGEISDNPWSQYRDEVTELVINEGITGIYNSYDLKKSAFSFPNLKSLSLPQSLQTVGSFSFFGCTALEKVDFPVGIKSLGSFSFAQCGVLSEIRFRGDCPTIEADSFSMVNAEAVYDPSLTGWDENSLQNYDGNIIWKACSCQNGIHLSAGPVAENRIEAGCENPGSYEEAVYCRECGAELSRTKVEIPALGHESVTDASVPAQCEKPGLTEGSHCSRCGIILKAQETVPALGHDFEEGICQSCGIRGGYFDFACWTFDENTSMLKIFPSEDEHEPYAEMPPWETLKSQISELNVEEGIDSVGSNAFRGCEKLESVMLPQSLDTLGDFAFQGCGSLKSIEIPDSVYNIGQFAFSESGIESLKIPFELTDIPNGLAYNCRELKELSLGPNTEIINTQAFSETPLLGEIVFPDSVLSINFEAFCNSGMKKISFLGDAPQIEASAFAGIEAEVQTPENSESWTNDKMLDYGGKLIWLSKKPEAAENRLEFKELPAGSTIYINNIPYILDAESGTAYDGNPGIAVYYAYVSVSGDRNYEYPTDMKVWFVEQNDSELIAVREESLDKLISYSHSTVRAYDREGIRIVNAIPMKLRQQLQEAGIRGLMLEEYGTVTAWDNELQGRELSLELECAKANFAYKNNETDPIFEQTADALLYTNVLIAESPEKYLPELSIRPYIKLSDGAGNIITIYGATVHRSIGFMALENRNAFTQGTEEYSFVWDIIHSVYGEKYDSEYIN